MVYTDWSITHAVRQALSMMIKEMATLSSSGDGNLYFPDASIDTHSIKLAFLNYSSLCFPYASGSLRLLDARPAYAGTATHHPILIGQRNVAERRGGGVVVNRSPNTRSRWIVRPSSDSVKKRSASSINLAVALSHQQKARVNKDTATGATALQREVQSASCSLPEHTLAGW